MSREVPRFRFKLSSDCFPARGGLSLFADGLEHHQRFRQPPPIIECVRRRSPVPRSASARLVMITSVGCEGYDAISHDDARASDERAALMHAG